ncbi:MAG: hypothetical protein FWF80_03925 [Defluviitaleaceae bacterium]|nr:hypothetical protein [Defluviitaleaceae bacterium]
MSISGISQAGVNCSYAVNTKGKANDSTVTAEYILERLRELGVLETFVAPDHWAKMPWNELQHSEEYIEATRDRFTNYTRCENGHMRKGTMFFLTMGPFMMERMLNDPDFREQQFSIIRHNISVLSDPRVIEATGGEDIIRATFLTMIRGDNGMLKFSISDFVDVDYDATKYGIETFELPKPQDAQSDLSIGLSEALIKKFSIQFAASGAFFAKQSEEYLLEYIEKIRQHMTSQPQRLATGETSAHSGITVAQIRSQDNPNGSSDELGTQESENERQSASADIILRDTLWQIASAFSAANEGLSNASNEQKLGLAFQHMLTNTTEIYARLARITLGNEDAADLSTEAIQQIHKDAQHQIDLFGEAFLSKFKQYGLDDGFNIAWSILSGTVKAVAA